MDWWKRLFDADWLIPMILGFVSGIAWIAFAFRAEWGVGLFEQNAVAVSLGLVRVNLLQLGLGCVCLILSGWLAVSYFYGDPYEHLP